jgi:hypothetical protein
VVWEVGNVCVVRLRWRPVGTQEDRERFQVLRIQDEKIREMAEYGSLGEATRVAKKFEGARRA